MRYFESWKTFRFILDSNMFNPSLPVIIWPVWETDTDKKLKILISPECCGKFLLSYNENIRNCWQHRANQWCYVCAKKRFYFIFMIHFLTSRLNLQTSNRQLVVEIKWLMLNILQGKCSLCCPPVEIQRNDVLTQIQLDVVNMSCTVYEYKKCKMHYRRQNERNECLKVFNGNRKQTESLLLLGQLITVFPNLCFGSQTVWEEVSAAPKMTRVSVCPSLTLVSKQ